MCGIFGIVSNQKEINIGRIALESIKRLEYRGYDSCGIVSQFDSKLFIKKDAGKKEQKSNPNPPGYNHPCTH